MLECQKKILRVSWLHSRLWAFPLKLVIESQVCTHQPLDLTSSMQRLALKRELSTTVSFKNFRVENFRFLKKKLKTFVILKIHVLYPGVKISFFSRKMKTNFFVILMNQIFLLSNWSRPNNWKFSKVRKNQLLSGIPSLNVATYADINPTWIRTFVPKNLRIGRNEKICFPWRINFLLRELEKVVIWSVR